MSTVLERGSDIAEAMSASVVAEPETAITTIQRGIAWLDKKHPGWADLIDLEQFDLTCGTSCVLGQVTGSWGETCEREAGHTTGGPGRTWSDNHGFSTANGNPDVEWEVLEREWKRVIADRQVAYA